MTDESHAHQFRWVHICPCGQACCSPADGSIREKIEDYDRLLKENATLQLLLDET